MKKRYIILGLAVILFSLIIFSPKTKAADLDRIEEFNITVDPRMNDGTLDITYEVKWRVLDSTTEGPLEWVKIGVPNKRFDNPTALSSNIKRINKFNNDYVRIDFNRAYKAGEVVTFKYSIHQSYMYKLSGSKCTYDFTPAWFTEAEVSKITVKWNAEGVKKSDSTSKKDNYLIWEKTNVAKGGKLNTHIEYPQSAFTALDKNKQRKNEAGAVVTIVIAIFIIAVFIIILSACIGPGYYGHRGFYCGPHVYHHHHHHGGCVRSSCACACASSCACACAGSGRAGCSKKDFYGTKLTTKKLRKVIKK